MRKYHFFVLALYFLLGTAVVLYTSGGDVWLLGLGIGLILPMLLFLVYASGRLPVNTFIKASTLVGYVSVMLGFGTLYRYFLDIESDFYAVILLGFCGLFAVLSVIFLLIGTVVSQFRK